MRTITAQRVTREDLRAMDPGEAVTFRLPTPEAIECGKATAYQMQHLLGCEFSTSADFPARELTITRGEERRP